MKFSNVAEKEYQKALEEPDKSSSADRYFRPNQIENNEEIEFIFLEEDPLEYWQAFGENVSDGKALPFRFAITDQPPSNEEILTAMGGGYTRSKCQFDNEKLGLKKNVSSRTFMIVFILLTNVVTVNCGPVSKRPGRH